MTPPQGEFIMISRNEYVNLFLNANPSESRSEVEARLDKAIAAFCSGARCECGQPIWIVGSAEAGCRCFTCITGDATPNSDYEIDVSLLPDPAN